MKFDYKHLRTTKLTIAPPPKLKIVKQTRILTELTNSGYHIVVKSCSIPKEEMEATTSATHDD